MSSTLDVGDEISINGTVGFKVVKVIDDNNLNEPLYLVHDANENNFTYKTEVQMSGSRIDTDDKQCRKRKRSATSSVKSGSSIYSTPTATNWSMEEKEQFNIKFVSSSLKTFFEQNVPDTIEPHLQQLVDMRWDTPFPKCTDANFIKLQSHSFEFELKQSEASVDVFLKSLFDIFNINASSKIPVQFGVVDMVLYAEKEGREPLFNCAMEVKGPAAYDIYLRAKYRNQLAAYMISMAIENAHSLDVSQNGKTFSCQKLLGILHIGLTPIFYKTEVPNNYLDAIIPLYHKNQKSTKAIPELIIHEFVPINPYTDREILRSVHSRSQIFKCYTAFKVLAENYACQKLISMETD